MADIYRRLVGFSFPPEPVGEETLEPVVPTRLQQEKHALRQSCDALRDAYDQLVLWANEEDRPPRFANEVADVLRRYLGTAGLQPMPTLAKEDSCWQLVVKRARRELAGDSAQNSAGHDAADSTETDPWANPQWILLVMEGMRKLLQRTGAVLGAAATALLAGLGYAQLHNLFPIPKNVGSWTHYALILAVAGAFGGAAWLTAIFFMAQRQILIGTYWDDDLGRLANNIDHTVARRIKSEFARQENAASLRAVELRAIRLASVARASQATDEKEADSAQSESDRLWSVVHFALVRTAATILESRSRHAFRGFPTIAALVISVLGIVGLFAFSDYYKGQRDLYQARTTCAQAEADGIVGACAAYESSSQTEQRQNAEKKLKHEAALKAAAALASLSPAQKRTLTQAAACEAAIAALDKKDRPSSAARVQAVTLCAASGK